MAAAGIMRGYVGTTQLSGSVRDSNKMGTLLDAAVKQGRGDRSAVYVSGVAFDREDVESVPAGVRKEAVAKAAARAEAMAKAAGMKLGKLSNIYEYVTAPYFQQLDAGSITQYGGGYPYVATATLRLTVTLSYKVVE